MKHSALIHNCQYWFDMIWHDLTVEHCILNTPKKLCFHNRTTEHWWFYNLKWWWLHQEIPRIYRLNKDLGTPAGSLTEILHMKSINHPNWGYESPKKLLLRQCVRLCQPQAVWSFAWDYLFFGGDLSFVPWTFDESHLDIIAENTRGMLDFIMGREEQQFGKWCPRFLAKLVVHL